MNTPHSIIPQSDDRLFSYFLSESVKGLLDFGGADEKKKREGMILFLLLGLIAIVGTEPLKVILRRNIGKLSISLPRLITACILYWLFAAIFYYMPNEYPKFISAFYAGTAFYGLLGLFVFVLGIKETFKASRHYNERPDDLLYHLYRGDSVFFTVKNNEAIRQQNLWLKTEPIICFFIGILLTVLPAFIHPVLSLLGAPVLMTAISFWFNEWYQINNVWDVQVKKIIREKQKHAQHQVFFTDESFNTVSPN